MDENRNPFEKKDPTTEIENILNENPIENVSKSKPQLKTYDSKKKLKLPKKKYLLIGGGILLIILIGFAFISWSNEINTSNQPTDNSTKVMSEEDFVDSIKQQIINKGYADLSGGLRVSPYIG